MNAHRPFDHHDEPVDRWLDEHQRALEDDLDTVLDVEAGLREVLLQSQHDALVGDLGTVLDVEAGLAAILPVAQPEPRTEEQEHPAAKQFNWPVSPEDRLALRLNPDVTATFRELNRARALDRNRALDRDLTSFYVAKVRKTIALVVGQDLPILHESLVEAFLDDFTTVDLRNANLIAVDLGGVRWSANGTKWPERMDIEALKSRSKEIGTRSGIYVVQSGSATVRDFADLT
ncbi:hypothetical protein [Streptosporangium carneum]|uniref:Uncharacterized protein n=1 Tax=Streptosporangium carneum TaxID=47481 RepID=A0A9W6I9I3_9ACTN|nr:hypothetical protein [Streptosporangium carneum]GLK14103.1 hypothetical protein GCM10017600_75150 [Streptosporangium carneum]